ncbi:L,D-transpeptidase [Mycoplana dimorpha]|uniref:Lipoprotein-anchoring transpeptidase ErfK/SrfK n=1 Tax=Mycoplana dimorpha TaxID=28320 RepID=A0A2T5BHL6_MYCDI|nr:L,D-transpeptidase [Mycoplana dimorpha]PTM98495.1 lipoprotein-anchoring transpeptidase ErfK/SrfK [Mycoplana dimorpha]
MASELSFSRRRLLRLSGLATVSALAGCTSSMNTDRFRWETDPVYRNPALEGVPGPWLEGRDPDQGPYEETMLPTGIPDLDPRYAGIYAARIDGGFTIPAVPYQQIDPRFLRREVEDPFGEAPGTIIVDTANRFLYLTQPGGRAMRYGVGIGRDGFDWSGRGVIQWKQAWPRWTPPDSMVSRQPELVKYSARNGGMAPGLSNPLGARALYIFQNGQDTLYRLHGTPEWKSIGRAVSSGCVRLLNQDVIDLYSRVPNKSPIVVI